MGNIVSKEGGGNLIIFRIKVIKTYLKRNNTPTYTRNERVRTGPKKVFGDTNSARTMVRSSGATTSRRKAAAIGHMVVTMRLLTKSNSYMHARLSEGSRSRLRT